MILIERKIWYLTLLILLTLSAGACSSSHDELTPWKGELSLVLQIGVVESGNTPTRASEEPDNYEIATQDVEKLHTVRIIIVKKAKDTSAKDTIVYNDYQPLGSPGNQISGLRYKVDFSTQYRIYLVANESGITDTDVPNLLKETLAAGKEYPENALENLKLSASKIGGYLINNTDESEPTIVPMSEMYDITTISRPTTNSLETLKLEMEEKLFVTRAASKFTFRFFKDENYREEGNQLQIQKVKITGLGQKEYLIPRDTKYSPGKYEQATNGERHITEFTLPDKNDENSTTGEHIFTFPEPISIPSLTSGGFTYSPPIYFPESQGEGEDSKFQCSISYDGEHYLQPVDLDLPTKLPRNTHVIVNITIGNKGALFYKVEVEPWEPRYHEIDFTDHVGIAEDGTLALESYASLDEKTGRLVLKDYPQAVSGSFGISTPVGARWYAYLVTISGEQNAIQFQTTDSEGKPTFTNYLTGVIDGTTKVEFKVAPTKQAGNEIRSAILQVMVTMADGLSVPVNILGNEYGENENITFIQNPQ